MNLEQMIYFRLPTLVSFTEVSACQILKLAGSLLPAEPSAAWQGAVNNTQ